MNTPTINHTPKARVFKDIYAYPVWQVYYGRYWVGAAHTVDVARTAAILAVHHAQQVCPSGVNQLYLIQHVTTGMPHHEFWEAAKPYFTHKQWHETMLHPLKRAA